MDYAIIIPCFNCERRIKDIITSSLIYSPNVIVINDGSSDNSLREIYKTNACVLNNEKNMGVGFSLFKGIEEANRNGIDLFVTIDADGGHNPDNIPSLLKSHIEDANDITIGDRWSNINNSLYYPSSKFWSNRFAASLLNRILNSDFKDVASGFRIINSNAFCFIKRNSSSDYGFLYQSILNSYNHVKIGTSPIDCLYNANELFFTKRIEIIGLIRSAIEHISKKNKLTRELETIKIFINEFNKVAIDITNDRIIALPLAAYDGYIFQYQNKSFVENTRPDITV